MSVNWDLVVEAVKALAWPVVTAFALYLLRRPLVELAGHIARRARKVSVFEVSVELTTLPELRPSWSIGDIDVRQLTSSQIFDSGSQALFSELLKPSRADFALIDLAAGREWLTSRLFVFALVLGEVTGLRAFVFVESAGGVRRRFLGVATPANVRRRLGVRYPWFEEAFARALAGPYPARQTPEVAGSSHFSNQGSPFNTSDQWRVTQLVQSFISELQRTTDPPANERDSYLKLEGSTNWERARWLDGELLERDLLVALDYIFVKESPDMARSLVVEAVLRRRNIFVALVDDDKRFTGLVDRNALLEQLALAQVNVPKQPSEEAS